MRTMRPGLMWLAGAALASLIAVPRTDAQQLEPYHSTMHFETGLINTPVAWVSGTNGDVWLNTSAKRILYVPNDDQLNFSSRWNTNIALETQWLGRFSLGVSAYSQNPEYGFFGRVLLLRDRSGSLLPGVAVGFRNLGPYDHEDRFLVGHDIRLQSDSSYGEYVGDQYRDFKTSPTLYAVATKDFTISSLMGGIPAATMSLSAGWGNGIFSDDGNLGDRYNKKGTIAKGLFLGTRFTMRPTLNSTLSILAENDGWDWNAGALLDWRGITAGIYGTELEEGSSRDPNGFFVYNYRKWNMTLGYRGNVFDIAHGILLRTRITELTREQQRLRLEIAARERRIRGLEVALQRARAGELADIARRRQELERQVQEERDAIRRAEERLRQIQEGQTPSTPPAQQPPTTTPPSF